jgi:hypothetical protein
MELGHVMRDCKNPPAAGFGAARARQRSASRALRERSRSRNRTRSQSREAGQGRRRRRSQTPAAIEKRQEKRKEKKTKEEFGSDRLLESAQQVAREEVAKFATQFNENPGAMPLRPRAQTPGPGHRVKFATGQGVDPGLPASLRRDPPTNLDPRAWELWRTGRRLEAPVNPDVPLPSTEAKNPEEWELDEYGTSVGVPEGTLSSVEKPLIWHWTEIPAGMSNSQFRKARKKQDPSVMGLVSRPFRPKTSATVRFETQREADAYDTCHPVAYAEGYANGNENGFQDGKNAWKDGGSNDRLAGQEATFMGAFLAGHHAAREELHMQPIRAEQFDYEDLLMHARIFSVDHLEQAVQVLTEALKAEKERGGPAAR